jgi:putative addiction module component (TIGR02574 family)
MRTLTLDEITRLSPKERLTLIGELWDSLDPADVPLTSTQRVELERQIDSFRTRPIRRDYVGTT